MIHFFPIADYSFKLEGETFYIEAAKGKWIEMKDVCDIYRTLDNVYYFTTFSFEDRTYKFYKFYPQRLGYQEECIDLETNNGFCDMGLSHDFIYSVINGGGLAHSTWQNQY